MPRGMMLAAGRGTRLGHLTDALPKPLLPVANRPVMAQGIRCLRRIGVIDICINVSYRAQQINDAFGNGSSEGVSLHWSIEDTPVGTAGGMKGVQPQLADDLVVVIAGDAMVDVDLAPLLAAHHAHGAFATLGTTPVADPSLYGVVVTGTDGRIERFQEKPAPGTEISRQANTGIYVFDPAIFELIPAGECCDFALHIFPEILRRRLPFYAAPVHGYWTDIGNPGDYLRANMDFLAQRIQIDGDGQWRGENFVADGVDTAALHLSGCVIGADVLLPPGCTLTNCVVWPGTHLTEPCRLSHAILTPHGIYQVEGNTARLLEEVGVGAG